MDDIYSLHENFNELIINKRKPRCISNTLQRFKRPLVSHGDFPSRVSLVSDDSNLEGEFGEAYDYSFLHVQKWFI